MNENERTPGGHRRGTRPANGRGSPRMTARDDAGLPTRIGRRARGSAWRQEARGGWKIDVGMPAGRRTRLVGVRAMNLRVRVLESKVSDGVETVKRSASFY